MPDHTNHTFTATWDAPIDEVRVSYLFIAGSPATGPDRWGPGEDADPDEVEVLSVEIRHGGEWRDALWLKEWAEEQFYDDLCGMAHAEREEGRAYARAEAREAA